MGIVVAEAMNQNEPHLAGPRLEIMKADTIHVCKE